jgi:hypothetical protein
MYSVVVHHLSESVQVLAKLSQPSRPRATKSASPNQASKKCKQSRPMETGFTKLISYMVSPTGVLIIK